MNRPVCGEFTPNHSLQQTGTACRLYEVCGSASGVPGQALASPSRPYGQPSIDAMRPSPGAPGPPRCRTPRRLRGARREPLGRTGRAGGAGGRRGGRLTRRSQLQLGNARPRSSASLPPATASPTTPRLHPTKLSFANGEFPSWSLGTRRAGQRARNARQLLFQRRQLDSAQIDQRACDLAGRTKHEAVRASRATLL